MNATLVALEALGRAVVSAALVGALLGAAALLLRRPLRRLPPRLQAWCWWLVAVRLLLELVSAPTIELAWLPPARVSPPAIVLRDLGDEPGLDGGNAASHPLAPVSGSLPAAREANLTKSRSVSTGDLWAVVGGLWIAGVAWSFARLGGGLRRLAGWVARSTPVDDAPTLALFGEARSCAGVSQPVALARSAEIATPLVASLRRPTVLLPTTPRLPPETLRLVLLHELLHLRRRDGWRALVPALSRRLFFFHPLAIWAEREHALATEAACDAEVVARAAAPADAYGELLVQFTLGSARRSRLAAAWSLAGPSIHRRLEMLANRSLRPRQLAALTPFVALALLAVAVPIRLVAADEPEAAPPAADAPGVVEIDRGDLDGDRRYGLPAPPTPPTAPVPPTPGVRWTSARAAIAPPAPPARPALPALPAAPAVPALPALAPLPPLPPVLPELRGVDWLVLWERDAKLSIDATRSAQRRAEELAERDGRPVLLLGRDGEAWVVRDAATIDAFRQAFFEQREGARQHAHRAREQALRAREESRRVTSEQRRALTESTRELTFEAARVARLAALEAQRVAELQEELERMGGERLEEARAQARVAARELAALERELASVREATDAERARRQEAAREAFEADRRELEAELEALEASTAESRREMQRELARLEQELERRLREVFERGLATRLEP